MNMELTVKNEQLFGAHDILSAKKMELVENHFECSAPVNSISLLNSLQK